MKKLGPLNYYKIKQAVQASGTFNPQENMYMFEESLTSSEYNIIKNFLGWVHKNKKTFGRANYEEIFSEWKQKR